MQFSPSPALPVTIVAGKVRGPSINRAEPKTSWIVLPDISADDRVLSSSPTPLSLIVALRITVAEPMNPKIPAWPFPVMVFALGMDDAPDVGR